MIRKLLLGLMNIMETLNGVLEALILFYFILWEHTEHNFSY